MPPKKTPLGKDKMRKWGDLLVLVRLHTMMLQDHLIEKADLNSYMKDIFREVERVNKKEGVGMTGGMKFWQSLMYALGFTATVTDPDVVVGVHIVNATTGAGIGVNGNGQTYQFQTNTTNTTSTEIAVTKGFDMEAARAELMKDPLASTVLSTVFNLSDSEDEAKLQLTLYFTRPVDYSDVKSSVVGMPLSLSPDGYRWLKKQL